MGKRLALGIAGLILAVTLAESITRLWSPRREDLGSHAWFLDITPHPLFGYVLDRTARPGPRHGFEESEELPYRRKRDEFVIAVLGGSVAMDWGRWVQNSKFFSDDLREKLPALKGRPIKWLNLALGGYKQPQQLQVATHYLDSADLFLNLEGYNELMVPLMQPAFSVESHAGSPLFQSPGLSFSRLLLNCGNLKSPLALFDVLAHACLRFYLRRKQNELAAYPASAYEKRVRESIRVWEESALRQYRMLRAAGKRSVILLQPNLFLPGSKPLSGEERRLIAQADFIQKARLYSRLPEVVLRLKRKGVNAYDLTMVFSKSQDAIYLDSCCHVNDEGNRILGEAIARIIVSSW